MDPELFNSVERPFRMAIYGDVNLNIVDGSAIWLTSLVESMHHEARVQQYVVLKSAIQRDILSSRITGLSRTHIISPQGGDSSRPLTPNKALDVIETQDANHSFDAIILRGFQVCRLAAGRPQLAGRIWPYLTDIPQRLSDVRIEDLRSLEQIGAVSKFILCQTDELRSFLEVLLPTTSHQLYLLPPMVPDEAFGVPRSLKREKPPRLFYAGKFAPDWALLEMVDAFKTVRADNTTLEFHIAGDKIHNPPGEPSFADEAETALLTTEGLTWHQAIPRSQVLELAAQASVALSPRLPKLNDSLELSTKILEYGATGTAVILNRNDLHERVLGSDYPLFLSSIDELEATIRRALSDEAATREAADRCYRAALSHSYDNTIDRLRPLLDRVAPRKSTTSPATPSRVLVAGHDMKFFGSVEEALTSGGFEVKFDSWQGHQTHDDVTSLEALGWADVIVCEWCLGNAVWYSQHHRPDQKMLIRLHRVELETLYPKEVKIESVDRIITVSPHYQQLTAELTGWPTELLTTIPNAIDCLSADRPKLPGAEFNIGMVGWVPQLKRLDRALDLLEALRFSDPRFRLILKGALPWEVDWIWDDVDQREFFEYQLARIHTSHALRTSVSFDQFGSNLFSWLRKVGYILSPSDIESFHVSLAEGMASRAVPVIWSRPGAAGLFSDHWISVDSREATERVLRLSNQGQWLNEGTRARDYVSERYSLNVVQDMWRALLGDIAAGE